MEEIKEGSVRVPRVARILTAGFAAVLAGFVVALLIFPGGAGARPPVPLSNWSKHCVSDKTDSFWGPGPGGTSYERRQYFQATACEWKLGKDMQAGLYWKYLRVIHPQGAPREGLQGGSVFYFQVFDCSTHKIVKWGVKDYSRKGNYGTHGTAQTMTFIVNPRHKYRARITGQIAYTNDGGKLWHFQIYPPQNEGVGARPIGSLNAWSKCY